MLSKKRVRTGPGGSAKERVTSKGFKFRKKQRVGDDMSQAPQSPALGKRTPLGDVSNVAGGTPDGKLRKVTALKRSPSARPVPASPLQPLLLTQLQSPVPHKLSSKRVAKQGPVAIDDPADKDAFLVGQKGYSQGIPPRAVSCAGVPVPLPASSAPAGQLKSSSPVLPRTARAETSAATSIGAGAVAAPVLVHLQAGTRTALSRIARLPGFSGESKMQRVMETLLDGEVDRIRGSGVQDETIAAVLRVVEAFTGQMQAYFEECMVTLEDAESSVASPSGVGTDAPPSSAGGVACTVRRLTEVGEGLEELDTDRGMDEDILARYQLCNTLESSVEEAVENLLFQTDDLHDRFRQVRNKREESALAQERETMKRREEAFGPFAQTNAASNIRGVLGAVESNAKLAAELDDGFLRPVPRQSSLPVFRGSPSAPSSSVPVITQATLMQAFDAATPHPSRACSQPTPLSVTPAVVRKILRGKNQ